MVGEVLQLGPGHIDPGTLQQSITQLQQEVEALRVRIAVDGHNPRQYVAQEAPGIHRLIDVRGAADPRRTAEAWLDALRAVFDWSQQPLMLIPERLDLPWTVHDCRDLSPAAVHTLVEELRESRAHRTVDLERGPLVTADLVLLPESHQLETTQPATLVLGSHHILTDGWSTAVMLRDLQRLLDGEELGPAPSFAKFARTLHQRSADELDQQHRVWLKMLTGRGQASGTNSMGKYGGVVAGLQQAPSNLKNGAGVQENLHVLHRDTGGRVVNAAASLGTTPSVLVQTAWLLTLAALHGGRRVTTGVTLSGRPVDQPRMTEAVDMFITTLPLHVYLEPQQTLRDTVQQVAETMGVISENQETPLPDIKRLAGSAPLFDTAVVYDHHAHFGKPNGLAGADTTGARPRILGVRAAGRTHYPLTVVCPPGDVPEIVLVHRPDVVRHALSDAAARWFTTFLGALCDAPRSGETRLLDATSFEPRLIELPSPLPHVETLAALAELYTAQILTEQQQGPFALIGYSFGGPVAECIAAELQRRGHKVNFLGILDAYPSGSGLSARKRSVPHEAPEDRGFTSDYDVQAIARADGAFHESTRAGVDIENNIRFCMQVLGTAEPTDYEGPVELVVAIQHDDDALLGRWDPAGAWRQHPRVGQVRVTELDLTHAQLVQEGGWEHIFRHWTPRLLGDDLATQEADTDNTDAQNTQMHSATGKD